MSVFTLFLLLTMARWNTLVCLFFFLLTFYAADGIRFQYDICHFLVPPPLAFGQFSGLYALLEHTQARRGWLRSTRAHASTSLVALTIPSPRRHLARGSARLEHMQARGTQPVALTDSSTCKHAGTQARAARRGRPPAPSARARQSHGL